MKNLLLITLLFVVVLPVVGQKTKHSPTDDYLQTKDTTYLPKTPKNELSCDFELLVALSCNYHRIINDKLKIGVSLGAGLKMGIPIKYGNSDFGPDGLKAGLLLNYHFSKKWSYEFLLQCAVFATIGTTEPLPELDIDINSFGVNSGIFFHLKKCQLGFRVFTGRSNIFERRNYETQSYENFNDFTVYTSLLILRVPLKNMVTTKKQ